MSNDVLTTSVIAKEALMILENNLGFAKRVYRGLETEYTKVHGYEVGDTVSIQRPADFTVRHGNVASPQEVKEGKLAFTVDEQIGVDFGFSSVELTLDIKTLGERVIKPAMIQLANDIDASIASLYWQIPNWVGTPGQVVNSFGDFSKAPERMSELAVPTDERSAALSPSDKWGMLGTQTGLFINGAANSAYREGELGKIAGIDTWESQNIATHITGAMGGTPLIKGASQSVTYDSVKDTGMTQVLTTDGWSTSVTGVLKAGDVITFAGVYAVNPVTKATLPFLKQHVVMADADSDGSGNASLTMYPAIIASGAFQNVSAVPADNAAITVMGSASSAYRQNLVFHKNAFGLAIVPMVAPPGAVDVARESYKGISVRLIPTYDGTNDKSNYRLDVLLGKKAIDPRLATRLSGTA